MHYYLITIAFDIIIVEQLSTLIHLRKYESIDIAKGVINVKHCVTIVSGMFEGRRPILYILDSDLIKAITIRDFDHFVDRNTLNTKEPRYLRQSLLNLKVSVRKITALLTVLDMSGYCLIL